MLGIGLALAAGTAQLIQAALVEFLDPNRKIALFDILAEGFLGSLCGAIIGFMVPAACRTNLIKPPDPKMAKALRNLLHQGELTFGSRATAENWVFTAHPDLPGITPAEAVQYEGLATGVQRLLDCEGPRESEDNDPVPAERHLPEVADRGAITLDPAAVVATAAEAHAPLH
jgi:hypothetical protein